MWRMVLALLVLAACGGKDPLAPTTGEEVGTYTLVSLNGNPLPVTLTEGGAQVRVLAGTLTLGTGGTVQMTTRFSVLPDTTAITNTVTGSYQRQGNALTFHYGNGGSNTGSIDGSQLIMTNEGVTFLFSRS